MPSRHRTDTPCRLGVEPSRGTETYAAVTLYVDEWRWAGPPFVLRTGKALAPGRRHILVYISPDCDLFERFYRATA